MYINPKPSFKARKRRNRTFLGKRSSANTKALSGKFQATKALEIWFPMEEGEGLVWKSEVAESMMSVTLGRVMSALLGARPRKLNDAITRLSSDPRTRPSLGSFSISGS